MSDTLPIFVSAGEALTDLIRVDGDHWVSKVGGSTWNVARAAASLGLPSAFAGAISMDWFGDALQTASVASGLDLRFLQRVARPPLLATVYQSAPPLYSFIGNDSADLAFDPAALPRGWEDAAQWVHFGGISLARAPLSTTLLELAERLHARGMRISYDPNFRVIMDASYDATLHRMARLASVIKVSDEDLLGLFRTDDVMDGLASLRALNPDAVVLFTRGAQGASLHVGEAAWQLASPMIEVVDTVGAGDACMAGLLCSMLRAPDAGWPAHLRYAVASGSAACLQAGATPPDAAQVRALAEQLAHPTTI